MATVQDLKTSIYYIRNVGSKTVIDLKGGSPEPGTVAQGWAKRELGDPWAPPQLWIVNKVDDGTYTIQNANSRTFLDLRKTDDGTPVEGFDGPSGAPDQKWAITQVPGQSYYVIQNKGTGKYVDLDTGNPANGTKVQGWAGSPTTANKNQLWYFEVATN